MAELKDVRAWVRSLGQPINPRGELHWGVIKRYNEAHPEDPCLHRPAFSGPYKPVAPKKIVQGSQHKNASLTEEEVLSIRERLFNGEPQVLVADAYGVSQSTVSLIGSRKTWRHI